MDSSNQLSNSGCRPQSVQTTGASDVANRSMVTEMPVLSSGQARSVSLLNNWPEISGSGLAETAGYRIRAPMPGMYDFVIVIGPDHDSGHIREIERHFRALGLKLLLVGDGQSAVSKEEFLRKAQGKIRPDAPIAFCFHSNVIQGALYLQIHPEGGGAESDPALCTDVLQWSSEITAPASQPAAADGESGSANPAPATVPWDGTRHLLGCYSGAAAHAIRSMPSCTQRKDMGAIIQHGSKKQQSLVEQDIRRLLMLGTQCAKNMRENQCANAYRQFAEAVQISPNTTTLSFPGDPEKLRVKLAKTEDAIHGRSLRQEFSGLQAKVQERDREPEAMSVFSHFSMQTLDAAASRQRKLDSWFLLAMRKAAHPGETHVATMKAMLEADPSLLHATDTSGRNALMYAAYAGNAVLLECLFSGTTQEQQREILLALNEADADGMTPLCRAACDGHADVVKVLLAHGARLAAHSRTGKSALMIAAESGQCQSIEVMNGMDRDGVRAVIDDKDRSGNTALHLALKNGDEEVARQLIGMGASCNVMDGDGRNAMMLAVVMGLDDLFDMLSRSDAEEARAAVNDKDYAGDTLLHLAINHSKPEIARRLIEMGATWTVADHKGRNAVMLAADLGRTEIFELLQRADASAVRSRLDMKSKYGSTALHLAIKNGHTDMARRLIEAGASCTVVDKNWRNAIMLSIAFDGNDLFEVLIRTRADDVRATLDNKDKESDTALYMAMKNGHVEIVRRLIKWGASCSGLDRQGCNATMIAVASGRFDLLNMLIDSHRAEVQASLEKKDYDGNTLLHLAIRNNHVEMAKWLIESGASCTVKDRSGRNAFMLAIVLGRHDILGALGRTNRADLLSTLNDTDKAGNTALHLAIEHGHDRMANWLIRLGASCTMVNGRSQNAVMLAIVCGRDGILKLVSHINGAAVRAAINDQDMDGDTALHLAIRHGDVRMAEWLIQAGASCSAKDSDGKNAVMLAIACGKEDVLEMMIRTNADGVRACFDDRDHRGNTVLHLAIKRGMAAAARRLIGSGASCSAVNDDGRNAVMEAAISGKGLEILEEMANACPGELRASINNTDMEGYTAHALVRRWGLRSLADRNVADWLIRHGAS